jgi:hypothetical protein
MSKHRYRGKRSKNWIQPALDVRSRRLKRGPHHRKAIRVEPAKKGALHRMLGIPLDQKIPLRTLMKHRHAKGLLGQRVRFALNVRRLGRAKKSRASK